MTHIEPPPPRTEPARRTHPVVYIITGVLVLIVVVWVVASIGRVQNSTFSFVGSAILPSVSPLSAPAAEEGRACAETLAATRARAEAQADKAAPPAKADAPKGEGSGDRKIVYNATLDLTVESVEKAAADVNRLVPEQKGYVAQSDVRVEGENTRHGSFTIRVPAGGLRPLLDALAKLGTPARNSLDSKDVTEEFVDLEARVKNLRQEEETLNKLMQQKAGNVDDVLTLRRHIQPIRESIERSEARLKFLSAVSALATITLSLKEPHREKPPAAATPPDPQPPFSERATTAFAGSWESFVRFVSGVALVLVVASAWLPVVAPGALLGWLWYRWAARRPVPVVVTGTPPAPPG